MISCVLVRKNNEKKIHLLTFTKIHIYAIKFKEKYTTIKTKNKTQIQILTHIHDLVSVSPQNRNASRRNINREFERLISHMIIGMA